LQPKTEKCDNNFIYSVHVLIAEGDVRDVYQAVLSLAGQWCPLISEGDQVL